MTEALTLVDAAFCAAAAVTVLLVVFASPLYMPLDLVAGGCLACAWMRRSGRW